METKRPLYRPNHEVRARFEEVCEEDNMVVLILVDDGQPWRLPLDRITHRFEDMKEWQLYVELWNTAPPHA